MSEPKPEVALGEYLGFHDEDCFCEGGVICRQCSADGALAMLVKQRDEAFVKGAEWMRKKAAKVAESYEPHCEACPRGVASSILGIPTKDGQ